jgi:flagellar basal-body rod modification protein FlgD
MSIASVAAQQNSLTAEANAAASGASGTTPAAAGTAPAAAGTTALNSLSGNFTDFLKMLMTQLQNQDPTSPMDTNAFTTELVQFSSVEQQINTNTSLTSLIQLTQAGEVMQGSNITGKQVTVTSDHLALQNGKGTIQFTTATAQPVAIAIYNDSGTKLQDATLTSVKGSNTWTWDGGDASGRTQPDGAYKVAVATADTSGTVTALPFSVVGTATGVQSLSSGMQLQMGALSVDFSKVQSVGK